MLDIYILILYNTNTRINKKYIMKKTIKKIAAILAFVTIAFLGTVTEASYSKGNVDTNQATIINENFWRLNGDVEDDSMNQIWFAFSDSDTGLSCRSSSQREKVDGGSKNKGGSFYANVSFLKDNKKYYFKACALDINNRAVEGRILEFQTGNGGEEKSVLDVKTLVEVEHSANSVKLKGRVSGAKDVKTWFAFSDGKDELRCERSAQKKSVYGLFDSGDYFYKKVNLLESNSKYAFKACAKNFSGDIFSGEVKTFSTNKVNYELEARAVTTDADMIGKYSVQLNGKVFTNNTENAKVYFLYGKDKKSLNLKTSSLKTDTDMYFQSSVKTRANTTYYFQTIVEDVNEDIIFKGNIISFKTKRSTIKKATPKSSDDNVEKVVQKKVVQKKVFQDEIVVKYTKATSFKDLIYKKTVSTSETKNYGLKVKANEGNNVFYKIRFVNNSDEIVKNFTFTETIPEGLEIVDLSGGVKYNKNKKLATWEVKELLPGESLVVIVKMRVSEGADKRTIVSSTKIQSGLKIVKTNSVRVVVTDDKLVGTVIDVESNETVSDVESNETVVGNGQSASLFNSNGPFPNTILGWLVIISLILLIAFIISKLAEMKMNSRKEMAELKEEEDNKMN